MATVVSVSGTSLTLEPGSGPNFTVTTNSSTLLQGFTALSALTPGELVQVDFIVQAPACTSQTVPPTLCPPMLLATRIQLAPAERRRPARQPAQRPRTSVSLRHRLQNGSDARPWPGHPGRATASLVTVTTNSSTVFAIAPQFVSLTGLPFTPTFTPTNLAAGQSVGVVASSVSTVPTAVRDGHQRLSHPANAGRHRHRHHHRRQLDGLHPVAPSGSAFTSLSGASTITVYTNRTPRPRRHATAAPPGHRGRSQVRFNGLVFNRWRHLRHGRRLFARRPAGT